MEQVSLDGNEGRSMAAAHTERCWVLLFVETTHLKEHCIIIYVFVLFSVLLITSNYSLHMVQLVLQSAVIKKTEKTNPPTRIHMETRVHFIAISQTQGDFHDDEELCSCSSNSR